MKGSRLLAAALLTIATTGAIAQAASAPPPPIVPPVQTIPTVLSAITGALSTYVAVLAGTSGLALALLEAFKKLFSVRGRFHRTAVIKWLSQDDASIPSALKAATRGPLSIASMVVTMGGAPHYSVRPDRKAGAPSTGNGGSPPEATAASSYDPAGAYAEFFHLTSGQKLVTPPTPRSDWVRWRGIDRAVFELEIARMMSQLQDAADAVLNNPQTYPNLYLFLTRGCSVEDANGWRAYMAELTKQSSTSPTKMDSDRYGRIRLLMRRQLDAFQGVTSSRWDELNQLWAILVGAVVLFLAQLIVAGHSDGDKSLLLWTALAKGWSDSHGEALFGIVVKAALGGALAPIAKDLLTSLSSLKFSK